MSRYRVLIEERHDGWIELRRAGSTTKCLDRDRSLLRVAGRFARHDFIEAAKATGSLTESGGEYFLHAGCDLVAERVGRIFEYFHATDRPTEEIAQIRRWISQYDDVPIDHIPDFAIAWADVCLRERLADAARSAPGAWHRQELRIDARSHVDVVLDELLRRYPTDEATRQAVSAGRETLAAVLARKTGRRNQTINDKKTG